MEQLKSYLCNAIILLMEADYELGDIQEELGISTEELKELLPDIFEEKEERDDLFSPIELINSETSSLSEIEEAFVQVLLPQNEDKKFNYVIVTKRYLISNNVEYTLYGFLKDKAEATVVNSLIVKDKL